MNCNKTCGNCRQNQTCDHVTGICPHGCAAGHSGSKCTFVNFAFGKPTSESRPQGNLTSNVTVDGNTTNGMCFSTSRDDNYSWLRVDLGRLVVINNVVINAANATTSKSITKKRLNGMKITVSKEKEDTMSDVCYEDTDPELPNLIQNLTCELVGRYVRIEIERTNQSRHSTTYSKKSVVELCEVEVTGCMSGMYGPNCELPCPKQCNDDMCFSNATCAVGCEAGYQGSFCNETCQDGYFGKNCQLECGNCLDNTTCSHVKGMCPAGCQTGWISETCKAPCSAGFYGDNCTETCGGCMNGTACNHTNGVCHDGCISGFKQTPTCREECENFTFGMNCSSTCGTCWNGTICEKATGACPQGCDPGWQAPYCLNECLNFSYGPNCSAQCGHCRGGNSCDPIDGNCSSGCEPGWQGSDCQMKCMKGTYGPNCTDICGNCQNDSDCDNVNGTCTKGCKPGWEPPMCTEVCMNYSYGEDCARQCGHCRNNETCDRLTGTCSNGCDPGWRQPECTQACQDGYFGKNCQLECGNCLDNTTCSHVKGMCPAGCQTGWISETCKAPCSAGFYGDNCTEKCGGCMNGTACNHTNGVCHDGCISGFKQTPTCREECENFTFGMNCSSTCGTCWNGTICEKATGACPQGCDPGWQAPYCLNECLNFSYGPNCSAQCGHCRGGNSCDPIDGNCSSGCEPGWQGSDCQMMCMNYSYGEDCARQCGHCRNNETCDRVTGNCSNGCDPGWRQPECTQECDAGYYLENCEKKCGKCKPGTTCNHVDGRCPKGCDVGWKGLLCNDECDQFLYGASCSSQCGQCRQKQSCNHITGNCDNGCEQGWESSKCDKKIDSTSLAIGIAAGVGIPIVLIGVLLIRFLMKKRRPLEAEEPKVPSEVVEMQPIDLLTFLSKRLQSNELHDEFKKLPANEVHACDAAKTAENKPRNRFLTTFPYDHSRVVLTGGGHDYINANYISNCQKKDVYVATQGPKKNTLGDFWRMIWQINSDRIVMLANCIEMGKHKVEQYWPEKGHSREFGEYKVVTTHVQTFAVYTVRTLSLYESSCETPKEIKQFHFTKWPDHGIPDIIHLLNFYKYVQSTETKLRGPMVVHCSAGIGRTGTFIAIDALVHYGTSKGNLAPFEYAKTMRQNRMNMIQTKEQYVAVHQVLMEYFLCDDSTLTVEEFQDILENTEQIQDEFTTLSQHRPTITLSESTDAMSEENISKNKDLEILPANRYRPLLMSQSPERTNYINAVLLPSCKTENALIVTQMPTDDTSDEFWAMVFDYQSTAIVFLDPNEEVLPTQSNPQIDTKSFSVDYVPNNDDASDSYNHLHVQNIAVTRKGLDDSFLTNSFEITSWPADDSESVSSIMKANYAVQSSQYGRKSPGPITVVCRNGSDKCGVFCAVSNAAETLNMNRSANIFLITRQLQYRRPSFIRSLHEYRTCYRAVAAHCETLCDYGNV
ncbi:cell death abnormality protein 1-like isoform X2 [Pecten maximus]|uniref:cell death abnormality protein 1-like isoform X2 n=1 Tax=Pecten maximus TaxID=6579 RepID=UPI001457E707|nr:cell death abnormality protein 1-like isoform X2 [Pecten maximus]